MEEVDFDLTGMAWNEEVGFGLTGMAWKGESQFCPDRKAWNGGGQFWPHLNGLDWQMSPLADWFPQYLVRVGSVGSGMTNFGKRHKEKKRKRKSKLDIKWSKKCLNKVKIMSKSC
jgi:hypothetical protein